MFDNINEIRRFVFKKEYVGESGTIMEGSEITIAHNCLYFNGGLMDTGSVPFFRAFLNNPKLRNEYLTKTKVPYNKV